MKLNVCDTASIDAPSAEQVRHYLQLIPPKAPFVILSGEGDGFMQARPEGEQCRVEYNDGERQHFALVPFEQAAQLLESYRAGGWRNQRVGRVAPAARLRRG